MQATSLASVASAVALLAVQAVAAAPSSAYASPPLAFVSTAEPRRASSFGRSGVRSAANDGHHSSRRRCSKFLPSYAPPSNRSQQLDVHKLYATIDDSSALQTDIVERLELADQFERWRFLQRLLEGELPASDVEEVLILSLSAYLEHGPTALSADNKHENGGNASPVLTEEQRAVMSGVIDDMMSISDGIGDSRFLHMLVSPPVDYESIAIDDEDAVFGEESGMIEVYPGAMSILQGIEKLLPDPVEDEEAFKSAWDVIIDLHGRESVRVREEALQREREGGDSAKDGSGGEKRSAENLQWRTLCAVGRVLVHYDFLTKGVLEEGAFR